MKPKKGEAASRERDGLQSTQSENVVEEDYTTKGEWDLDYELDQVAEITSPLEQSQELRRLKKKSGESLDVLCRKQSAQPGLLIPRPVVLNWVTAHPLGPRRSHGEG